MNGEAVVPWAFLLKIIFTAATLGAGYKGGEIVPSFFIGATFGYTFGNLIGFSPFVMHGGRDAFGILRCHELPDHLITDQF